MWLHYHIFVVKFFVRVLKHLHIRKTEMLSVYTSVKNGFYLLLFVFVRFSTRIRNFQVSTVFSQLTRGRLKLHSYLLLKVGNICTVFMSVHLRWFSLWFHLYNILIHLKYFWTFISNLVILIVAVDISSSLHIHVSF